MTAPVWVLLPGLDGTGALFDGVTERVPDCRALAFPPELTDYDGLEAFVREWFPSRPFVVVAESFSGPLGVRLAANPPPHLIGVVLVATFVTRPRWLPWLPSPAFGLTPPAWAIRRWMLGDAADGLVGRTQAVLRACSASTVASRVAAIRHVDERASLAASAVPLVLLEPRADRLVPPQGLLVETVRIHGPHLLLQASPDACVQAIRTWLDQVSPPTGPRREPMPGRPSR